MPSSILIFEINKKILLYKILTDELYQLLKNEIVKNFGTSYVNEKNNQENLEDTQDTSATEIENSYSEEPSIINKMNETKPTEMNLTNDLIYEYFSPIVASFEISKDINYTYEYALFNKNQYIIRFILFNNCLTLCILNNSNNNKIDRKESDMNRLINAEYFTSWYCKSFISIVKYKFGICSDEKCFSNLNQIDIKNLYTNWSHLFANDPVYYLEAIEQLQVNEDIKIKCEAFLNELVQFFVKTETIMSEFDYMDESYDSLRTNLNDDEDDNSSSNFPFQNDEFNLANELTNLNRLRFTELESFFTDISQINQFLLSCGSKLLYKFKQDTNDNRASTFTIDSSSIFMLLLEATSFLDNQSLNNSTLANEDETETFGSVNSSPLAQSVRSRKLSEESKNRLTNSSTTEPENFLSMNSLMDNFQSVYSTPSFLNFNNNKQSVSNSFISDFDAKDINPTNNNFDQQSVVADQQIKKVTKFKKTNCFLKTSNKTLGFYEILLIKLSDNLCLTMIKTNKLTKYCELISDFDNLIVGFNDLLNRKRLQLSSSETDSSLSISDQSIDPVKTSKLVKERNLQLEKIDKAFFSFFMNKLIYLFDKLRQLKGELNSKANSNLVDSNLKESSKNNLFNGAFKFKNKKRTDSISTSTQRQRTNNIASKEELMKRSAIRLIHALQFKLNQLTNSKQFKLFAGFINNEINNSFITDAAETNDMLSNIRNIETQINAIRLNTTDLFYELFIAQSSTINDEIDSYEKIRSQNLTKTDDNRSSSSNSTNTILFKSAYLVDNIKELYKKHIYHYCAYIEVKWRRNTSMSFFWNLYAGLIHFSFINRQDNIAVIPTIETNLQYNLDESKINLAYRKYVPIVFTFFTRYQCTQFHFTDDKLNIVFSYLIWFEDKKSNYLPVDFSASQLYNSGDYLLQNSKIGKSLFDQNANSINSSMIEKQTNQLTNSPGITNKNNYDLLQNICYPNALANSLTCYELYCIHTPQLEEEKIKLQLNSLMNSLSKRLAKNGSFEFY